MKAANVLGALKAMDLVVLVFALLVVWAPPQQFGQLASVIAVATATDAQSIPTASRVMTLQEILTMQVTVQNLLLFCAFLIFWHVLFSVLGLYSPARVGRIERRDLADFAKAAVLGASVILAVSFLAEMSPSVTQASIAAIVVACSLSLLARLLVNAYMRHTRSAPATLRHIIIVGTNTRAVEVARRIEAHPERGYKLVGFVDEQWTGGEAFRETGYKVLTDFAGFQEFLKDNVVDEVAICTPFKSLYDRAAQVFAQCEQQGITVRFRSDLVSPTIGRSRIESGR